jgi:leucyl-tRNA synthetase
MPQWAGSSWYFLRYIDPHCDTAIASPEALAYWLPVDWYNGGMEHTTLHLLYSRFWHRFLYDIGVVPTKEPYAKRTSHGMILGEDGQKMSKSRRNVINPDDTVAEIGADAFRMYEMFMGAFDQPIPWATQGARGCRRFIDRVWRLLDMIQGEEESDDLRASLHGMIKKVSDDFEKMKFNTAIAAMMSFVNDVYAKGSITRKELGTLLMLLNPVAPHVTEEMWQLIGGEGYLYNHPWPQHSEEALETAQVEVAVQVLGKIKARLSVPADADAKAVEQIVMNHETIRALIGEKPVRKFIYIPGRLVNIVI